jgi:beta-glucosidase
MEYIFPKDFLWGAATSSHQVEGGNSNNDWWEWEQADGQREKSGLACRHYELYRNDFDLVRELSHNCHRFSIEWSRVVPAEGEISRQEIGHYVDVVNALRERNLLPIVTLHHFTNPIWFAKIGGWASCDAVNHYLRYVLEVVDNLADKVKYWVTLNEPMIYLYFSYIDGSWPPQEKSISKAKVVMRNLILAHRKAYRLIHAIYKKRNLAPPLVSIAHNMQAFVPCLPEDKNFSGFLARQKNRFSTFLKHRYYNLAFIDSLRRYKTLDFIGVNYYSRALVDVDGFSLKSLLVETCRKNHSNLAKNSLGWDIYPRGLYDILIGLKKYRLPVFILENGICTQDDSLRWDFIRQHLESVGLAMRDGVSVLGYVYWSLIDNFEWDKGFGPRFGLVDIDYKNFNRTVRESARKFSLVCRESRIE